MEPPVINRICVACGVEYAIKHNGVVLVEMGVIGPLAVYRADLYACPSCGHEMIGGVADEAEVRHNEAAFEPRLKSYWADQRTRLVEYWMNPREKAAYENYCKAGGHVTVAREDPCPATPPPKSTS